MQKSFSISYGSFSDTLLYSDLDLKIRIPHRFGVVLNINGDNIYVYQITGHTPKTYHSGHRAYGKYIFILPDNYRVKEEIITSNSNNQAYAENKCLLRLQPHAAQSIGFDIYRIEKSGIDDVTVEIAIKIKDFQVTGVAYLSDDIFIPHAMPVNLPEIIPNFPGITQGWSRLFGYHLYAITSINLGERGDFACFIPFATDSELFDFPNISTQYLKSITNEIQ